MKLSVCIPTYNRYRELKLLVDYLLSETEFEVCVSDNGSTDETVEYLKSINDNRLKVNYFGRNKGPGVNFLKVVEISTGDYCWMMGSDDFIDINYLDNLLILLEKHQPDVSLLSLKECNSKLDPISQHQWSNSKRECFDFDNANHVNDFFNNINPLWGLVFGYLSSVLIKKVSWDRYIIPDEYVHSYFSFSYKVYKILDEGGTLLNFNKSIVLNRGYNDSIISEFNGDVNFKRMVLDVDTYIDLSNYVRKNIKKEHVLIAARKNYSWYPILKIRMSCTSEKWKNEVRDKLLTQIRVPIKRVTVIENMEFAFPVITLAQYFKNKFFLDKKLLPKKLV